MRVTKQTHYAISILTLCAKADPALVKVADIARALDLTPQNTFKSVHLLARAGFVAPVRGPSGGVRLARPAQDIRVSEVVLAIETDATGEGDETQAGTKVLDQAFAAFLSVLEGHTIADLARASASPKSAPRSAKAPARKRPLRSESRAKV